MSKRNLFEKRVNLMPYEYPELIAFRDAIRHSYWLTSEFNFSSDIQDYHVNVTPQEKSVLTKSMLAIAQIEVAVKLFWGDLYKYLPKPEINGVGVTFAECHIEGTEILTPSGWVNLKNINIGDLVCQFNPEDKTSEFVPALRVIKAPYTGNMYRFYKRKWECVVTPNHRMLDYDENGNVRVREAKNFWSDSSATKPFTSFKKGVINELSDMDRLKIAIQADGHWRYCINKNTGEKTYRGEKNGHYTYSISLLKERKIERLERLLEYTGLPYRRYTCKNGKQVFEIDTPMENYKNFDWVDLTDKSCWWCNDFIEELSHWDGYRLEGKKDCWIKYSTIDKSCADKVQAIGTLAGYWANINHYVDNRSPNFNDCYTVSFINNRWGVHHNHNREVFRYSGMVYCVTVPSGFIITRYNNTVSIEGNSEERHSEGYASLLEILGMADMFSDLSQYPALMSRYDYIEAFMANKNESKSEFVLSLILFSLFVEHISLFGQFLVIMSFNKHKNMFKGISNVIEATSKEEEIHGRFGIALYGILKEEHPDLFTEEFYQELTTLADSALKAEKAILHWIFEEGDLDFIDLATAENYIIHRYNNSLEILGIEAPYLVDEKLLDKTRWFDQEILAGKENDFFYKRSTDYSKKQKQITADDLF